MREGVRGWVQLGADGVRLTTHQVGKAAPAALLAGLSACAVAPVGVAVLGLQLGTTAEAALTAVAGVGTNILSDLIMLKVNAWRDRGNSAGPDFAQMQQELSEQIEQALAAGDERATLLRGEIAAVLEQIGAADVAIRTAVEQGDQRIYDLIVDTFARLESRFAEFSFLLTSIDGAVVGIQQTLNRQEAESRFARQQRHQTLVELSLLRESVAVVRQQTRPRSGKPGKKSGVPWPGGSPYRGLLPFEQSDAEIFYGREKMTASLAVMLAGRLSPPSILVVTAPSGAGKSSLLRAGLLPHLAKGRLPGRPESKHWPRLVLTPSEDPLGELAAHLANLTSGDAMSLAEALASAPDQASLVARQAVLNHRDGANRDRLVLVVDQFEEVFSLEDKDDGKQAAARREAFVRALRAAAQLPVGPDGEPAALVVLGVREDFLSRCLRHDQLADVTNMGVFTVEPMREHELRQAIIGPARRAGLVLEHGLADVIMSELRTQATRHGPSLLGEGVLPLLSHAMLVTWENREGDMLTRHGYGGSGGVADAVCKAAENAYASLTFEEQELARQLFYRLTAVGPDGRPGRRPVAREELDGQSEKVLEEFTRRRLVIASATKVELTHDVLLEAWPRLREWLKSDQDHRILYGQLREDAEEWNRRQRDPSFLYRGTRLQAVQEARVHWRANALRYPSLPAVAEDFLSAGDHAAVATRRRLGWFIAVLAVVTIIAVVAAVVAVDNAGTADKRRRQTLARMVAAQGDRVSDVDPVLSGLLAAASDGFAPVPEARYGMLRTLATSIRAAMHGHTGTVRQTAFSPDGKLLATVGDDNTVRLWDAATGHPHGAPLKAHAFSSFGTTDVGFSPDGAFLVTVGDDDQVLVWDLATRGHVPLPVTAYDITFTAFSPDRGMLAVADQEGMVEVWDVAARRRLGDRFVVAGLGEGGLGAMAFSPDGKTLAVTGDGGVHLWSLQSRTPTTRLPGDIGEGNGRDVRALAFSPDSGTLAVAGGVDGRGRTQLWDLTTRRPLGEAIEDEAGLVFKVSFSPDGKTLATGGRDGHLWDLRTRLPLGDPLKGHSGDVTALTFSPDGRTLTTAGTDGVVRAWHVPARRPASEQPFGDADIQVMALSPDGKTVATVTEDDNGVQLWDLSTRRPVSDRIEVSDREVFDVAFSPDGARLAIGTDGNDAWLWDIATRTAAGPFSTGSTIGPNRGNTDSVTFGSDGKILATAGDYPVFWDVASRRRVAEAVSEHSGAGRVAFSPDGRYAATGGNREVQLWEVASWERAAPRRLATGFTVRDLAFSPDSRLLAVAGDNGGLVFIDTTMHSQVGEEVSAEAEGLTGVAFSPDGKMLAAGLGNGTIQLWDVDTRRPIAGPFTAKLETDAQDWALRPVFTPDGKALVTVINGALWTWDVSRPSDLTGAICAVAGRSLTEQEWRQYVGSEPFRKMCQ
ncbi:nSTAND1 domain-containing NTPase [Streptosporangium sandarakinum]